VARAEAAQRAAHDASDAAKRKANKARDSDQAAAAAAATASTRGVGAPSSSLRSKVSEGRAAQRGALRGDKKVLPSSRSSESEQRALLPPGNTGVGQRRHGLPPARRSVSQPLGGHHGEATALPSSEEMDELRHKHKVLEY